MWYGYERAVNRSSSLTARDFAKYDDKSELFYITDPLSKLTGSGCIYHKKLMRTYIGY